MLLAIDIGNSQIACGVLRKGALVADWRLATDHTKTPDEYGILIRSLLDIHEVELPDIHGCIITSVVPPLTKSFEVLLHSLTGEPPCIVTSACPLGLTLRYDNPEEIGADRLVNAAAAFAYYQRGLIIVDFGTATTFCTITKQGEETEIITKGRHDPCVGIRAVPVGEAMMACVILDHLLLHRGQVGAGPRGKIG